VDDAHERLDHAIQQVIRAEQQRIEQQQRVEHLRQLGLDTKLAEELLDLLCAVLEIKKEHLAHLQNEVAELEKRPH